MEQQEKKFGFFRQIATAVAQPKKYERFLHLTTGRVIAFVLVFTMITTFLGYCLPFIISQVFGESYMDIIDVYVPEFTLKDEVLTLSEPVAYDDGNTLVIANSNIEEFNEAQLAEYQDAYTNVYLLSKTNMVIYTSGQNTSYRYADLAVKELDKEGLRAYVPSMYLMVAMSCILNFILDMIWYFLGALLLMLFAWSMKGLWKLQFGLPDMFKIGVFSQVLYGLLVAVLRMFGLELPMSFFVGLAVGFVYMNLAVKQLRADGYKSSYESSERTMFGRSAAPTPKGIYSRASMRTTGYGEKEDTENKEDTTDTEDTKE